MTLTLDQMKEQLLSYKDFYGGEILDKESITNATEKWQLKEVINNHASFLEDQLSDALSHLSTFNKKIGLNIY